MLAVVASMALTACNDDGYYDVYEAPATYYAFPKPLENLNITAAETVPASYDVIVTRSTSGAAETIPVTATFSSDLLSGGSEVVFEAGKTEAIYTITFNGTPEIGVTYTANLKLDRVPTHFDPNSPYSKDDAEDEYGQGIVNQLPPAANLSYTFNFQMAYTWSNVGSATVTSMDWSGAVADNVPIIKANEYAGPGFLYRLVEPYAYLEYGKDAANSYVEFYLNDDGSAWKLPLIQPAGFTYSSYNMAWVYSGANSSFTNDGSTYTINMLEGACTGPVSLDNYAGAFGVETLVFDWIDGYPFVK